MSQADDIRKFAITNYVTPARVRGDKRVSIRAGDVHRDMKLNNAVPAVCSAIGGTKFCTEAGVREVSKEGPSNSTTSLFTFDLLETSVFGITQAEAELKRRYGDASVDTEKMVSFNLPDGRAIALQRDITKVQLWFEDDDRGDVPRVEDIQQYAADRGRHSNLPDRLSDKPPDELRKQGFPKPVFSLRVRNDDELKAVLDWYEQKVGNLDILALEKLKAVFVASFPDFEKLGFEGDHGTYWDTERHYKQNLIDRAARVIDRISELQDIALGGELLAILTSPESNILGWRITSRLSAVRSQHKGLVEEAAGALVRTELDPPAAVAEFVKKVWPVYSQGQQGNMPYRDVRTVPTALLALAKPSQAVAVRYQPIHTAGMRLLHRPLLKNAPFSAGEYRDILSMADDIAKVMRNEWGWHPHDLWDIQGFIWATCNSSENRENTDDEETKMVTPAATPAPKNLILYGPPGTGKTYQTISEAVMLCDPGLPNDSPRSVLMSRYNALKNAGRIAFVTFHQSYSYEDFVEGLRPETGADEDSDEASLGGFRLKPVAGIFKRIATLAEQAGVVRPNALNLDLKDSKFFKMSLGRAFEQSEIYQAAIDGEYIALGWGGDIDWSDPVYEKRDAILNKWRSIDPDINANSGNVSQTFTLRSKMREGDIVIISDGNSLFRAIGEIIGPYEYATDADEYRHRRKVRWLRVLEKSLPVDTIIDGRFTQMALYLIDPARVKREALETILGTDAAPQGSGPARHPDSYVLIIDEINRANISKVFGELITLIEADKRLGQENALTVTLPYSNETFGVPANLHIVGTMNTADRSIALLDTALRRRFEFRELMPRSDLLSENVGGINLRALLTALNARIEYIFDREHQIGHAYFMDCATRVQVDGVMRTKIIPLLAEYFYENWEKVRQVLGEIADEGGFIVRTKLNPPKGSDGDGGNDRWRYTVRENFAPEAYSQLTS